MKADLKITVPLIRSLKNQKRKISALTAYDYSTARLLDQAGIDILLIGDSLGTVFQGHATTLPVTLEETLYHCRCVSRAASRSLVVGDLPFLSYQVSESQAVESAGRLLKEGGVSAVKLEGGIPVASTIQKLVSYDIPVMAHVGLTPQSYHRMGGHKVQGKVRDSLRSRLAAPGTRERIIEDAKAAEAAGAFAVVLEGIPSDLAAEITRILSIPTVGIGAGPSCDGQILVVNDLLGMDERFKPKFVKRYADLSEIIRQAAESYIEDLQSGEFPGKNHSF